LSVVIGLPICFVRTQPHDSRRGFNQSSLSTKQIGKPITPDKVIEFRVASCFSCVVETDSHRGTPFANNTTDLSFLLCGDPMITVAELYPLPLLDTR